MKHLQHSALHTRINAIIAKGLLASVSYSTLAPTAADACQRGPAGAVISLLVIQQATASIPRSAAAGEQRRHITAKCSVQQARQWCATQRSDRER